MRFFIHSIVCLLFIFLNGGCGNVHDSGKQHVAGMTDDVSGYISCSYADGVRQGEAEMSGESHATANDCDTDRLTDLSHPEHRTLEAIFSGSDNTARVNSEKPQRLLPTNCNRAPKHLGKLHSPYYNNPQKISCSRNNQPQKAVILPIVSCSHFIALRHIIR